MKWEDVNLHYDSQNVLHLVVMYNYVKHINVKYHFIKDTICKKSIRLVKINNKINPSDAPTNIIPLEGFKNHFDTMQFLHKEPLLLFSCIFTPSCFGYNSILANFHIKKNLHEVFLKLSMEYL